MLDKIFEETSLKDLIAFRDALNRYIEARQYTDSDVFQSEQVLEKARQNLAELESELAAQTTIVEDLKTLLLGEPKTNEPAPSVMVVPAPVNNNHNGYHSVATFGANTPTRNRKYMIALLGISSGALSRWTKSFSAYLSDRSRKDYLFTTEDETVLLKVKELRDKKYDTATILKELGADGTNRIA